MVRTSPRGLGLGASASATWRPARRIEGHTGRRSIQRGRLDSGGEKTVTVFAAATRERVKGDPYLFTSDRTGTINYQEYAIRSAQSWSAKSNGLQHGSPLLERRTLAGAIANMQRRPGLAPADGRGERLRQGARGPAGSAKRSHGSVLVYVHGYYTGHQEAVFRGLNWRRTSSAAGAVAGSLAKRPVSFIVPLPLPTDPKPHLRRHGVL